MALDTWNKQFGVRDFTPAPDGDKMGGRRNAEMERRGDMETATTEAMTKRIALGADHAGYEEKEKIKATLDELGIQYVDMGTDSCESVDYPDYARKVAEAVSRGDFEQGLLVCGSGTGMAIAANKVKGVRAAVAWSPEIARLAREHNDANILSLPARFVPADESARIVKSFFEADFEGGRHGKRVDKIKEFEGS